MTGKTCRQGIGLVRIGHETHFEILHDARPTDALDVGGDHDPVSGLEGGTDTVGLRPLEVLDADFARHRNSDGRVTGGSTASRQTKIHVDVHADLGVTGGHVTQAGLGVIGGTHSPAAANPVGETQLAGETIAIGLTQKGAVVGKIKTRPVYRPRGIQCRANHPHHAVDHRTAGLAVFLGTTVGGGKHVTKLRPRQGHLQIHAGPNVVEAAGNSKIVIDAITQRNQETPQPHLGANRLIGARRQKRVGIILRTHTALSEDTHAIGQCTALLHPAHRRHVKGGGG